MTDHYMPRVMTAPELAYVRSEGQSSSLYLAIYKPPVIYSAVINQVFTTFDKVIQVTYDTGSGNLSDVINGMTMYVGTAPGYSDVGMVRIRKTPTATVFYIGENSDITWADNLYLSVVDDFGIWARHISIASKVAFMDYDIAYSDQHTHTMPIPILGPRFVPVWKTLSTVTVPFDASLSYCLPDTSISSYLWVATGSISSTGLTTATPTITYSAAGTYRVSCTITAANSKTSTGYVYVQIFDNSHMPVTQFDLKACGGSFTEGGWKTQITMWAQADFSTVVDRAMIVLFARDFYDTTEISLGQIPNRNNIVMEGWVSGESIIEDPDGSSVDFTIDTAQTWMKRITGFPMGIQNFTKTANAWTNWFNLTVDASLYHLFLWQSTVIPVIDVFLTGDLKVSAEQAAVGDTTVYDQLTYLIKNTLLGSVGCDRFNRLFCEVDTQLTPVAERTGYPVVINLQPTDWRDRLAIIRTATPVTSQVNLSGVSIAPPKKPLPLFSLAPGHVFYRHGKNVRQDRMLLSTQALSNELAALKLAWDNHNFEFSPDLSGNNRMLDVFPSHQYVGITVSASDTPRGFTYSGNVIVREVNISWDQNAEASKLQISWRCENEVFPGNSTDGDTPNSTVPSGVPKVPAPSNPPPPLIDVSPSNPSALSNVVILVPGVGVFYTNNFSSTGVVNWFSMNDGLSDPTQVWHLEVSLSGRCFCQISTTSIWSADAPGSIWTKVFDNSMIGDPEGYPFPRYQKIVSFGIDKEIDDSLLIVGSVVVTIFGQPLFYLWSGSSASVALVGTPFFNDATPTADLYSKPVVHGIPPLSSGIWVVPWQGASGTVVSTFAPGSATPSTNNTIGGSDFLTTIARFTPTAIISMNGTVETSMDSGVTYTNRVTSPTIYPRTWAIDTTADGMRILIGTQYTGLKKSTDNGATWGLTSFLGAVTAVANLGTNNDWLFADAGNILYTPDFGATWTNHTGDLQTWIGAFGIISTIRWFV